MNLKDKLLKRGVQLTGNPTDDQLLDALLDALTGLADTALYLQAQVNGRTVVRPDTDSCSVVVKDQVVSYDSCGYPNTDTVVSVDGGDWKIVIKD